MYNPFDNVRSSSYFKDFNLQTHKPNVWQTWGLITSIRVFIFNHRLSYGQNGGIIQIIPKETQNNTKKIYIHILTFKVKMILYLTAVKMKTLMELL